MSKITNPDALKPYRLTTVDFENLANLDGSEFGFAAGQPYASLGLSFEAAIVSANADLNSTSSGVAVRSAVIYAEQFQNFLSIQFSYPQEAFGFFYRDARATSIQVQAFDSNYVVLEEAAFATPKGFAGMIRPQADVFFVNVLSAHNSFDDADQSRTFIDDLSFASSSKKWVRPFLFVAWLWMILIGVILITPIGPLCIVCGNPIGGFTARVLGVVSVLVGLFGLGLRFLGAPSRIDHS
jgi:hypothetical protein